MINNPEFIEQIKNQIRNLSPELLDQILNEVEEQEMIEKKINYQINKCKDEGD